MPGMFDFLAPEMRLLEKWKKKVFAGDFSKNINVRSGTLQLRAKGARKVGTSA